MLGVWLFILTMIQLDSWFVFADSIQGRYKCIYILIWIRYKLIMGTNKQVNNLWSMHSPFMWIKCNKHFRLNSIHLSIAGEARGFCRADITAAVKVLTDTSVLGARGMYAITRASKLCHIAYISHNSFIWFSVVFSLLCRKQLPLNIPLLQYFLWCPVYTPSPYA